MTSWNCWMISWNLLNDVMEFVKWCHGFAKYCHWNVQCWHAFVNWSHGNDIEMEMVPWNLSNDVMKFVKWCHGISQTSNPTSLGLALESVRSDIDMDAKFGFVSKKCSNPEIFVKFGGDLRFRSSSLISIRVTRSFKTNKYIGLIKRRDSDGILTCETTCQHSDG